MQNLLFMKRNKNRSIFYLLLIGFTFPNFFLAATNSDKFKLPGHSKKTEKIGKDLRIEYYVNDKTGKKDGPYQKIYLKKLLVSGQYQEDNKSGNWNYKTLRDTLILNAHFKNNLADSTWKSYYNDGKLSAILNYKEGHLNDTLKGYHTNGKLATVALYKIGSIIINRKNYYPNGNLHSIETFSSNNDTVIFESFFMNGSPFEKIIILKDKPYTVYFIKDSVGNNLGENTLQAGNGRVQLFDEKLRLKSDQFYIDGKLDGTSREYNNGVLVTEANYHLGIKDGGYITYFESKSVRSQGVYRNGLKSGVWYEYDEKDNQRTEQLYKIGSATFQEKIYRSNKLVRSGERMYNTKIGFWTHYNTEKGTKDSIDLGSPIKEVVADGIGLTSKDTCAISNCDFENTIELAPSFNGGLTELINYLVNNLQYPELARDAGLSDKVYLSFVVELTGELSDFKVIKGAGRIFDEESVRILKSMPPWIPAKSNGVPVRTRYSLPLLFRLQ